MDHTSVDIWVELILSSWTLVSKRFSSFSRIFFDRVSRKPAFTRPNFPNCVYSNSYTRGEINACGGGSTSSSIALKHERSTIRKSNTSANTLIYCLLLLKSIVNQRNWCKCFIFIYMKIETFRRRIAEENKLRENLRKNRRSFERNMARKPWQLPQTNLLKSMLSSWQFPFKGSISKRALFEKKVLHAYIACIWSTGF